MSSPRAVSKDQLMPGNANENSIKGYSIQTSAALVAIKEELDKALKDTPLGRLKDQMIICRAIVETLDLGFSNSSQLRRSILDVAALAAVAERSDAPSTLPQKDFNLSIWYRKDLVECLDQLILTGLTPSKANSYQNYEQSLKELIAGIRMYL